MVKGYKFPQKEETEDNSEDGIEKDNVVTFEVITGGKEPPSTGDNWLSKKSIGSCFLAKKRAINPTDFSLGLFRIGAKTEKSVVLNTPEHPGNLYVNPITFCNVFIEFEDLGVMITPQEEEQEKESDNDDGDRIQSPDGGEEPKVE